MTVLRVWIVHRAGRVHDPRPRLHGQAIHATTNSTSPSPFSLPSNGGPGTYANHQSPPPSAPPFFTKVAVAVVSSGVILATLSRPRADSPLTRNPTTSHASHEVDASRYTLGIAMLVVSLICTGVHGALQERTYSTYGPCWRESIFYTVRPIPLACTHPSIHQQDQFPPITRGGHGWFLTVIFFYALLILYIHITYLY